MELTEEIKVNLQQERLMKMEEIKKALKCLLASASLRHPLFDSVIKEKGDFLALIEKLEGEAYEAGYNKGYDEGYNEGK